jgi:choline-sulfatase
MNSEKDKNKISRKEAFKRLGGLALFPLATSGLGNFKTDWDDNPVTASIRKSDKGTSSPNILFIMDDQHRGDYLSCAGSAWIKTPHIDSLAKEGARFSNFYCAVPSCTPARTSLLTGLTPWNHGMLGYMNNIAQYYRLTMPQFFSEMGYDTIVTGKNHFGPPRNTQGYKTINLEEGWYTKNKNGFICDYEAWFHRVAPGKDINATGLSYNDNRGGIPFPYADELHATHWTADRAIDFLKNSPEQSPWFLKLSFQRPHPPFDAPKRWMDYYESLDIPIPQVGEWAQQKYRNKKTSMSKMPEASSAIFPDIEIKASRAAYAGSISFVDEQIGRVIAELKKTGQYENTFILFCSDHGEMLGDQHMWRKCRPYQPSANIPLVVRWPSKFGNFNYKRGQTRNELVELRDIFPTFADVCNFTIPSKIDGESILKILNGTAEWRTTLCSEHSLAYEPDNAWIAIRDKRYKYIFFTLTGAEQLFDLQQDPYELNNIVATASVSAVYKSLYDALAYELSVRGEVWVKDGKLQVQKKSVLMGENFPHYKVDQSF